jgi:hypothetical protein
MRSSKNAGRIAGRRQLQTPFFSFASRRSVRQHTEAMPIGTDTQQARTAVGTINAIGAGELQ